MDEIKIERIEIDETESKLFWNFVHDEFTDYAKQNDVELNFEEFCFAAKDDDGSRAHMLLLADDVSHSAVAVVRECFERMLEKAVEKVYFIARRDSERITTEVQRGRIGSPAGLRFHVEGLSGGAGQLRTGDIDTRRLRQVIGRSSAGPSRLPHRWLCSSAWAWCSRPPSSSTVPTSSWPAWHPR